MDRATAMLGAGAVRSRKGEVATARRVDLTKFSPGGDRQIVIHVLHRGRRDASSKWKESPTDTGCTRKGTNHRKANNNSMRIFYVQKKRCKLKIQENENEIQLLKNRFNKISDRGGRRHGPKQCTNKALKIVANMIQLQNKEETCQGV